jgi:tetratricopeptide (TPR) repeat protein
MKTKIFKYISVLAFVGILGGCSEDFLDTTPQGSVPMESFFKTDADAAGTVLGVYDIMQSLYAADWNSMWMLKTLQADELLTGGGGRGDQPAYEEINEFRYGSSNSVITKVFQMSYWGIYRANLVLENVKPESDIKKRSIAEAKALRAMLYFDLVNLWGKVPLVLTTPKSPSEYNYPRSETAAVWAQIEKDLKEAIVDLPLRSTYAPIVDGKVVIKSDMIRVTKGAAQAMLGKSYLYQKKYAEAAAIFQTVIDSKEYELNGDYSQILRKGAEFGKESLFEISYSSAKNYDWGNFQWGNNGRNYESNIHWELCGPRGDGFFDGGTSGLIAGWGFANPDSAIYKAFEAGDVRRQYSVMNEAEVKAKGGKMRNADKGNALPWSNVGLVRLKYGTWSDESLSAPSVTEVNYGTNFRLIRYADVLLMAAEAYNKSGNDGAALLLINQVRKRAELADLTETGDALFQKIKAERRVELAFEGVRFMDLIRWGDAATVLANQGKKIPKGDGTFFDVADGGFKAKNVLLPIPETEISVNPLASPNNDGY